MRRLATLPPYPSTLPLLSLSLTLTLTLALTLSLTLPRGARQHFKEHAVLCFAATLKGKDKVDPGHPHPTPNPYPLPYSYPSPYPLPGGPGPPALPRVQGVARAAHAADERRASH